MKIFNSKYFQDTSSRKLSFLILAVFLSGFQVLCQESPCGTDFQDHFISAEKVKKYKNYQFSKGSEHFAQVPVQVHVIGANNGLFGLDSSTVYEELEILNSYFADIDIVFLMCNEINYINDNRVVTFVKSDSEWICEQEDIPNALNIYYAPHLETSDGESICGYASDFKTKPRIFMDNNCSADGATLSHEFGHSFSLVHTHRTAFGEELASGSNCENAGDYLCDTPADPRLSRTNVNDNCEYIGTVLDNEQNAYNPSVGNVMSYSPAECVNNFSEEQLMQMRAFYDAEGFFLTCLNAPSSTSDISHSSIEIYPNPGSTFLTIENAPLNSTIQIWNANGQILKTLHKKLNKEPISIENFTDGIYYLTILSAHSTSTKTFTKISQ